MFPVLPRGLRFFGDFHAGERAEYVKLVVAQLRCRKLGLASEILGGGTVFTVPKSGGRLREVWNGRRVSIAETSVARLTDSFLGFGGNPRHFLCVCPRETEMHV